jgi:hypothetical protein
MRDHTLMVVMARILIGVVLCLAVPALAPAADVPQTGAVSAGSAVQVSLFRIFFKDGSSAVSYGEYARVADEVVFSMPLGAPPAGARLQLITLPAALVDWPRTEQNAVSIRARRYAETRGESDFATMTAEVAAMLNDIALTTDRARALTIADEARRMLAAWPASHFGYRQSDIGDIVALIDAAIRDLDPGSGPGGFQLSLVAMAPSPAPEPPPAMPTPREQVTRLVTLVSRVSRSTDRVTLLRAALAILDDPGSNITSDDAAAVKRSLESQLHEETQIDARYTRLSERLIGGASRAAARASVSDVERMLDLVDAEDARLGGKRPELVQALRTTLSAQLESARDLRLRRDQWLVRRDVYRHYVESISALLVQLVKAESALEAIRRLAGPSPGVLEALEGRLSGGADRLQRMSAPEQIQPTHELFVTAWRFAESAADARHRAIVTGDLAAAWQASSAAAGSLMLLARAQQELRGALEPPKLR